MSIVYSTMKVAEKSSISFKEDFVNHTDQAAH